MVVKNLAGSITNLDALDNLDKLEKLDRLEQLNQLQHLDKLNHLDKMGQMDLLDKLNQLDKLDQLGKLDNLNNLNQLTRLNQLQRLDNLKFDDLHQLQILNKLDKLDQLQHLQQLDRLAFLDRLTTFGPLELLYVLSIVIPGIVFYQVLKLAGRSSGSMPMAVLATIGYNVVSYLLCNLLLYSWLLDGFNLFSMIGWMLVLLGLPALAGFALGMIFRDASGQEASAMSKAMSKQAYNLRYTHSSFF